MNIRSFGIRQRHRPRRSTIKDRFIYSQHIIMLTKAHGLVLATTIVAVRSETKDSAGVIDSDEGTSRAMKRTLDLTSATVETYRR